MGRCMVPALCYDAGSDCSTPTDRLRTGKDRSQDSLRAGLRNEVNEGEYLEDVRPDCVGHSCGRSCHTVCLAVDK
jgi:hypothetical protein